MTTTVRYVIGSLDVGGAERHLSQILPALAEQGLRLSVYTISYKGALAPKLEAAGIEIVAPPFAEAFRRVPPLVRKPALLILSIARLWLLMLRHRADIVHFFLPEAYLLGGIISLFVPVPVRIMSRRSLNEYQTKHPILARIERNLHGRMNAVIGNSSKVAAQLAQEGVPEDKLGLIHNGIDMAPFEVSDRDRRERARAALGIANDSLVMVLVANLIPYKGHADLLRALALAAPGFAADWAVLCVGRDAGIGEELRGLTNDLGIGGHVRWLGERHDVPELLAAADIGLLCSHEEGFSNAILEGMATALPMIVTDVGGNSEAVIDGQTGYVVPARDPKALAEAIRRLAADGGARASMGGKGKARVKDYFSVARCVSEYVQLYEGLAGPDHRLPRALRMVEKESLCVDS